MEENMIIDAEMQKELTRKAYYRYIRHNETSLDLPIGLNPVGGILLHEEFESKLMNAINRITVLRELCTQVKTSGDRTVPIVTGYGHPAWVPEGGDIPTVKDTFDKIVLDSHKLVAITRMSSDLIKESAIDIEQMLADTFADRMAPMEEETFISGDGVNKPLGLLQQAAVSCETQTAGTVSVEDILNLVFSVPEKYRRNGTLLMNEKTLLSLYKQCSASGTNLWLGKTNDGKDDTLFGYRIVRCSSMPEVQSGSIPVLFGDFKKVYINDCGDRGFRRMKELYSEFNQVAYMLGEHVGIRLAIPDAIKGLKVI